MQTPAVGASIAREAGGQLSSPAITCLHCPLVTVTGPQGRHSPLCSHCLGQKTRRHADHSPSLRPHIQASSRSRGFDFKMCSESSDGFRSPRYHQREPAASHLQPLTYSLSPASKR